VCQSPGEGFRRSWNGVSQLSRDGPKPLKGAMWRRSEVVVAATRRGGKGTPFSDAGAWTLKDLHIKSEPSVYGRSMYTPSC
jgi:hypothetical protein